MSRGIAALRLVGVGFFIGTAVLLGTLTGLWLDSKLNTKPIFVIFGLFMGIAVAFYGVYRMLLPLLNKKKDREDG